MLFYSNANVIPFSVGFSVYRHYNYNYRLYNYSTSTRCSFYFAQAQVVKETCLLKLYILLCGIKQERTATKERRYKKPAAKAAAHYLGKLNSISDAVPEILCNDTQVVKCHLKWLSLIVYVSFPSVWFEVLDLGVKIWAHDLQKHHLLIITTEVCKKCF